MPAPYNPFSSWFGAFQLPLSGNVAERISAPMFSPSLTINDGGDQAIEARVVNEIASYGKQIGWLNDVILALAENADLPDHVTRTVHRIAEATRKIEELKAAAADEALGKAVESLNFLQQHQPGAYARLLQERSQTLPL
jgi:hypothetical protein